MLVKAFPSLNIIMSVTFVVWNPGLLNSNQQKLQQQDQNKSWYTQKSNNQGGNWIDGYRNPNESTYQVQEPQGNAAYNAIDNKTQQQLERHQ